MDTPVFNSVSILSVLRIELAHQHATNYTTLVVVGLLSSTATHPSGLRAGHVDALEQDIGGVPGNRTLIRFSDGSDMEYPP
jgi:hypothetical protein